MVAIRDKSDELFFEVVVDIRIVIYELRVGFNHTQLWNEVI